jgi:hypothetical protein
MKEVYRDKMDRSQLYRATHITASFSHTPDI